MPTAQTKQRARRKASRGLKPSAQAGELVREEMHKLKAHDGNVRSRKQAVAIGLSEARRAGIKVGSRRAASPRVRRQTARDTAIGQGQYQPDPTRSAGAKKAARTRARRGR